MKQKFKIRQYKTLLSYFFLAVPDIFAYKIIQESNTVFEQVKQLTSIISPFIYGFYWHTSLTCLVMAYSGCC